MLSYRIFWCSCVLLLMLKIIWTMVIQHSYAVIATLLFGMQSHSKEIRTAIVLHFLCVVVMAKFSCLQHQILLISWKGYIKTSIQKVNILFRMLGLIIWCFLLPLWEVKLILVLIGDVVLIVLDCPVRTVILWVVYFLWKELCLSFHSYIFMILKMKYATELMLSGILYINFFFYILFM